MQKFYIETYGCQMNVSDSEIVISIMKDNGYEVTKSMNEADILFVNTCSVRENAEQRVRGRLDVFRLHEKAHPGILIGVLGCMAERLKHKLIEEEKVIDLVIGPDAYRDIPRLVKLAETGQKAVNVLLSREETYADISPVRTSENKISAFVSIMRGCDNMCTYCVVPFTRGRERSRSPQTIVNEVNELISKGFKEVTLLGQNVDKYFWKDNQTTFAQLLEMVAKCSPSIRVRFSTSYPQDITDDVLHTMIKYPNICKYIHFPCQSGSTRILEMMRRGYTREQYMERIEAIRRIVPWCGISTDIISGFCSETEEDHQQTLSLMQWVKYDFAYMFKYSVRPNTYAERNFADDVPENVKTRRLTEIINLQQQLSAESNKNDLNKIFEVLIEGESKKSKDKLFGRNSQNKVVVFHRKKYKTGDYVKVKITDCTSATLIGEAVE